MRRAVAINGDELRPRWRVQTPHGGDLLVEYDSLRSHWRISPGEYVRRNLGDALAQATGEKRQATWILELERKIATIPTASD